MIEYIYLYIVLLLKRRFIICNGECTKYPFEMVFDMDLERHEITEFRTENYANSGNSGLLVYQRTEVK